MSTKVLWKKTRRQLVLGPLAWLHLTLDPPLIGRLIRRLTYSTASSTPHPTVRRCQVSPIILLRRHPSGSTRCNDHRRQCHQPINSGLRLMPDIGLPTIIPAHPTLNSWPRRRPPTHSPALTEEPLRRAAPRINNTRVILMLPATRLSHVTHRTPQTRKYHRPPITTTNHISRSINTPTPISSQVPLRTCPLIINIPTARLPCLRGHHPPTLLTNRRCRSRAITRRRHPRDSPRMAVSRIFLTTRRGAIISRPGHLRCSIISTLPRNKEVRIAATPIIFRRR